MRIAEITDLETAKEVARLMEQELGRLYEKIEELTRELAKLRGQDGSRQLELELRKLQERNALLERELFGRSSEKRGRGQEDGSDEENERPKGRGHGPHPQQQLEIVAQQHGFDGQACCKVCGGVVEEWAGQFEEAEEVTVIERRFVIVKHQRQKARCRCYATVMTAPGPTKLIPGGRYSIEFAVHVAVGKYLDHLPLNRQAGIMEREGLTVDSQTLWDQIEALAKHLEPTYEALRPYILARPLLHADETPWYLLDEKPAKKWYVWCVAVEDAAYYWIRGSRSAKTGAEVLAGYRGFVVVDGYKAYDTLAHENRELVLVYCWSHVRRKLIQAEPYYPEARTALDLIRDLYAVEKLVPSGKDLEASQRDDALRLRARMREERSRPIVEAIHRWATTQNALPECSLRSAIEYMLGLWPGLTRFLDDPRIPLDNNLVERQLRGPVVGRKNHYGSRSRRGTEVSAILYSLLQTAKVVGVEPKAYLLYAARTAIEKPGTSVFPHELLSRRAEEAGDAAP